MSLTERLLIDRIALGWAFAWVTVVRSRPAERESLMHPVIVTCRAPETMAQRADLSHVSSHF